MARVDGSSGVGDDANPLVEGPGYAEAREAVLAKLRSPDKKSTRVALLPLLRDLAVYPQAARDVSLVEPMVAALGKLQGSHDERKVVRLVHYFLCLLRPRLEALDADRAAHELEVKEVTHDYAPRAVCAYRTLTSFAVEAAAAAQRVAAAAGAGGDASAVAAAQAAAATSENTAVRLHRALERDLPVLSDMIRDPESFKRKKKKVTEQMQAAQGLYSAQAQCARITPALVQHAAAGMCCHVGSAARAAARAAAGYASSGAEGAAVTLSDALLPVRVRVSRAVELQEAPPVKLRKGEKPRLHINAADEMAAVYYMRVCAGLAGDAALARSDAKASESWYAALVEGVGDARWRVAFEAVHQLSRLGWQRLVLTTYAPVQHSADAAHGDGGAGGDSPSREFAASIATEAPAPGTRTGVRAMFDTFSAALRFVRSSGAASAGRQGEQALAIATCSAIESAGRSFVEWTNALRARPSEEQSTWNAALHDSTAGFVTLVGLLRSLLGHEAESVRLQLLCALLWCCPSSAEAMSGSKHSSAAVVSQIRGLLERKAVSLSASKLSKLQAFMRDRVGVSRVLAPLLLAIPLTWVTVRPAEIETDALRESWILASSFGSESRRMVLRAVYRLLDTRPVTRGHKAWGAWQRLRAAAFGFLGEFASFLCGEWREEWYASPAGAALAEKKEPSPSPPAAPSAFPDADDLLGLGAAMAAASPAPSPFLPMAGARAAGAAGDPFASTGGLSSASAGGSTAVSGAADELMAGTKAVGAGFGVIGVRNPALRSVLLRLHQAASFEAWQIRQICASALIKLALRSHDPVRLFVYELLRDLRGSAREASDAHAGDLDADVVPAIALLDDVYRYKRHVLAISGMNGATGVATPSPGSEAVCSREELLLRTRLVCFVRDDFTF